MKYSLSPRVQAIFHHISQLESQYRHSHLPNIESAATVAKATVTSVPANVDPAVALEIIVFVEVDT